MTVKPRRRKHPVFRDHFAREPRFSTVPLEYRQAHDFGLYRHLVPIFDFRQGAQPVVLVPERIIFDQIIHRKDAKGVKLFLLKSAHAANLLYGDVMQIHHTKSPTL
ncbi:hypothetical protein D3C74_373810 [compost metagenome]